MKPVSRVLDVTTTLGGEKVDMTIDHSALAHIMSVLTDLYSDPELAVIREYSTNALDSHIEAGQTRPIEITLPSPLSPFLRIRDYGIGMDADGIRDTYSRYGTSTKRGSDDVVGMLGLGCKSALTYTDQFTLTGIKDGRMIQVSIGRDEDGSGSMSIVADHATDDLPGVEVIIPAKRHNEFEGKAHDFFRFWKPGTVLVNGEQPERVTGTWITDDILISSGIDQDYVVMGNVPYPVPDNALSAEPGSKFRYRQQEHTVAFVPIGAVQFTPSRESLQMTKLTQHTLEALKIERDSHLEAALRAEIEASATAQDAISAWVRARRIGFAEDATYRGRKMRSELYRTQVDSTGFERRVKDVYLVTTDRRNNRYRLTGVWTDSVSIQRNALYVENFDGASLTSTKREKLAQYLAKNHPDGTGEFWLFVAGPLTPDERFWLDGATVLDWSVVNLEKLPRDPSTKKAGPRGAYKGRNYGGDWYKPILASEIDTTKPVLYYRGNRWGFQYDPACQNGMIPEDVLVVCLEANRVEKFRRDFPMAMSVRAYAEEWVKKQVAGWDATKLKAAHFQRLANTRLLKQLPADQLNDPALKEGIKLAGMDVADLRLKIQSWGVAVPEKVIDPLDKYPLLQMFNSLPGGDTLSHAVLYLNAAHAAEGS